LSAPGAGSRCPPAARRSPAVRSPPARPPAVHHVASNVDSSTGPLMPVQLALGVTILAVISLAAFWNDIQDDDGDAR
jgi:hypothetical protein